MPPTGSTSKQQNAVKRRGGVNMIFVDKTAEEWTKIHGCTPSQWVCKKCKVLFKIDIPVITKDHVGFVSPVHDCGIDFVAVTVMPTSKKVQLEWKHALEDLTSKH
jgi:hypothetical protein